MIGPANMRDASYVCAHLGEQDFIEVSCQFTDFSSVGLASYMLQSQHVFIAYEKNDRPVMVFGAQPIVASTVSAWALGTSRSWRAIPQVTRFCNGPLAETLRGEGYKWAEARSYTGNVRADRWLRGMGGEAVAHLPAYGKGGEDFTLFRRHL